MRINVRGGTNAGIRVVKETKSQDWKCECGADLRFYWTRCPECKQPRP